MVSVPLCQALVLLVVSVPDIGVASGVRATMTHFDAGSFVCATLRCR